MIPFESLTMEQQSFIKQALDGRNVLVEACIGSGKTTSIQCLCQMMPPYKVVLYLTFNRLLKEEAKVKITAEWVRVTNYHGFAYGECVRHNITVGVSDSIQTYLNSHLPVEHIDVLIMDEYQDINGVISQMLRYIVDRNPGIQVVAVGDMAQKMSNHTVLEADKFIHELLGKNLVPMEFTTCFRLNDALAQELGKVWGKEIHGVNTDMQVMTMSFDEALEHLLIQEPGDVLCLGSNEGPRVRMLNELERRCPEKFNKDTVWSKVTDTEGGATSPRPGSAIFTTFDGCKGMERDVCVVFDWTLKYWNTRMAKPGARYEIIRNIFCVAASRGKREIIFVDNGQDMLSFEDIRDLEPQRRKFEDMDISSMFDYKFDEHLDEARACLVTRELQPPGEIIDVPTSDGLIDLSMCIGMYLEMSYFSGSAVEQYIDAWFASHPGRGYLRKTDMDSWTLDEKILYLTVLETGQQRYYEQARRHLVTDSQLAQMRERLAAVLPADASSQVPVRVPFYSKRAPVSFKANGFADVVYQNTVYELKFTAGLSVTHYLQCAMYMIGRYLERGILWNVRTNQMVEIRIPNRQQFLDKAMVAATLGDMREYAPHRKDQMAEFIGMHRKMAVQAKELYLNGDMSEADVRKYLSECGLYLPGTISEMITRMREMHRLQTM